MATSNTTGAGVERVGWVGAGRMGLPMLGHVLKAGHTVRVYTLGDDQMRHAVAAGAAAAGSAGDAAAGASIIFSSLPHDAALREAALGADGIVAHARPGAIYLDTSTVSLAVSAEVARAAAQRGIHYLRAPVSGNNRVAEAGELTVIVSGPRAAFERALPLLKSFGVRHFYVGVAEEARLMKLVVNLMVSVTAGMLAEALALGRSGGLDWNQMLDVIDASAVASPMVKVKIPPLRRRDFTATMTTVAQTKDVDLILDLARDNGVPMALTAAMRQMFQSVISTGGAEEDYIAVVKLVERLSGLATEPDVG